MLNQAIPENEIQAARTIFDPIPRVDGIETAGDPLLNRELNLIFSVGENDGRQSIKRS